MRGLLFVLAAYTLLYLAGAGAASFARTGDSNAGFTAEGTASGTLTAADDFGFGFFGGLVAGPVPARGEPTATPTPSPTPSEGDSSEPTPTPDATATPEATATATATATPTPTATPEPSPTATPTP